MATQPQEPVVAGVQKAQLCKLEEIHAVAGFLQQPALDPDLNDANPLQGSILVAAACKVNPAAANQTIIAIAYDDRAKDSKALSIILLDTAHRRVLADYKGRIDEDASMSVQTGSLWIDTANYALAKDVRAFAVDEISGYMPSCADGGIGPSRYLYIRDGRHIRPVLSSLDVSYWEFIRRGNDRCNTDAPVGTPTIIGNTTLSLAVAPTSLQGFRDLVVTAEFSRDDDRPTKAYDNNPCGLAPFHYLLHYDGKEYKTDKLESALMCGNRWNPPAIVVKSVISRPEFANTVPAGFLPSMQVNILDSRPGAILVQRFNDPARIGWLPSDAIALPSAFKPLNAWNGQVSLHVVTKDIIDGDSTYQFLPDGTYTIETKFAKGAPARRQGHLYAYGPVLKATGPMGDVYFWLQGNGTLCVINRESNCSIH
jgi:hypothetical protein